MRSSVIRHGMALFASLCLTSAALPTAAAGTYADAIPAIKPSVVAVGTYLKTRRPPMNMLGTGFVVADGQHVFTNEHVLPTTLARGESLIILTGSDKNGQARSVLSTVRRSSHDLALLRMAGPALPALRIDNTNGAVEGQELAFTGFPLGIVLGLHPVTHRALLAGIVPMVIPARSSRELDASTLSSLRRGNFKVFQLDATAYPGNSGSPLFDPTDRKVYGIVNMVFVKTQKESLIKDPSGISYAIPARFMVELLRGEGLTP